MKQAALSVLLLGMPFGSFAQADERSTLASRFAAEQQFRLVADENARLNGEIAQLNSFAPVIDRAKQCVEQVKFDGQRTNETLAVLRKTFEEFRKTRGDVPLTIRSGVWQRMNNAIGDVYRLLVGNLYDCIQPINSPFRQPGQIPDPALEALREAASPPKDEKFADMMPNLSSLVRSISYDERKNRSEIPENDIKAVDAELRGLSLEPFSQFFSEQQEAFKKRLDAAASRLKTESDIRATKIKQNSERLAVLDKSLVDKQAAQSALDRGLVWAIYGMIVALMVLFLSLRIFPSDLAKHIVQERSMVELISMAFMLLTIIILGTGQRIGNETIGTLLGTIAGYIFGRKMAEERTPGTGGAGTGGPGAGAPGAPVPGTPPAGTAQGAQTPTSTGTVTTPTSGDAPTPQSDSSASPVTGRDAGRTA